MSVQVTKFQRQIERYKLIINQYLKDPTKPWTTSFDYLESETNVPRMQFFYGGVAFCALYLVFGYGAQLLCNLIGILYPTYMSIQSLEMDNKAQINCWIIYWLTFSFLSLVEFFPGPLLYLIPIYWLLKCVFLIWCMLPTEQNGAHVIYTKLMRPYVLKIHDELMKKPLEK